MAKLIIGLGNPGRRYQNTRHNLGFAVVEELKDREKANCQFSLSPKFKSLILPFKYLGKKLILVNPQTYMNKSGTAVAALASFYKLKPENIWVIHDDIDLPLGKLRIRLGGGSGGHNGVESIIKHLGTEEFVRFRLGIGKEVQSSKLKVQSYDGATEFVLSPFEPDERDVVTRMIGKAADAVLVALEEGIEAAMNRYN